MEPVENHNFKLKCLPETTPAQKVMALDMKIYPQCDYSTGRDTFGNLMVTGCMREKHDIFLVSVHGKVQTTGELLADEEVPYYYQYQSEMTRPGENIKRFYVNNGIDILENNIENAAGIMEKVHNMMTYKQGVTTLKTTAEEAFGLRQGVCQDYTHIMLSILRMKKIPVRYAVGMMAGEGASHAWVEIWHNGCWYGMDPTNNCMVNDNYIKISHGRDYKDCLVERGMFVGKGCQQKLVGVSVVEEQSI